MSNNGLAVASKGTTTAPTMYKEIEQMGDVARGHVEVKEIIAYDFVEKRKVIEKEKVGNEIGIKWVTIENGRAPYFCQTKEQEVIFKENNPDARIETFSIQLLKSTAIKYLDDPRNVKQFIKPVEPHLSSINDAAIANIDDVIIEALGHKKPNWREQAKQLGIPMYRRTKVEVLADIAASQQIPTTTSVS